MSEAAVIEQPEEPRQEIESAVVRFAGDSGDGMQLTGSQFTMTAAISGNDLATFPDFPAEIRAPAGTTFGVSAFQINFGARKIMTSGDQLDVLVVMNPAALITNLEDVKPGGIVIADSGAFTDRNLAKAGYAENPLDNDSLDGYRLVKIDMSRLTVEHVGAGPCLLDVWSQARSLCQLAENQIRQESGHRGCQYRSPQCRSRIR
jgi:2-oxoglutarate/2-oxoacid ferredoxin oxidoreductase subunit alpha